VRHISGEEVSMTGGGGISVAALTVARLSWWEGGDGRERRGEALGRGDWAMS
jgi:hypothetical protein